MFIVLIVVMTFVFLLAHKYRMGDAKQCPWCKRWCLKDDSCNYIFSCGLDSKGVFHIGAGCGRSWCWQCGKKFCSQYHDPQNGQRLVSAKDTHTNCCIDEIGFIQSDYCPGGHNSHCEKRW